MTRLRSQRILLAPSRAKTQRCLRSLGRYCAPHEDEIADSGSPSTGRTGHLVPRTRQQRTAGFKRWVVGGADARDESYRVERHPADDPSKRDVQK
ncbi:MAG: hypothetical protein BJ554DRAFT_4733 [Olpidium bornovanus]|uniref:Uncharacterized protein n=1 Tax=Olpidium bornovanus TaxID=278681 RepID=A0A8H7ZLE5_9FUNG|nr:MAG: hypothetical protein BJ554DRAFT_4733 [Olpidium bornovanus]